VHVLRSKGGTSIAVPRMVGGNAVAMNYEIGTEPALIKAYREGGGSPPAVSGDTIYSRAPRGPSSSELATATEAWLKQHAPEVLDSKVEALFRTKDWLIVWTPPYCPKFQPIELVWGAGKQRAATMWYYGRDLEVVRHHLRLGFYGAATGAATRGRRSTLRGAGRRRRAR
jgi:hypothetical protein